MLKTNVSFIERIWLEIEESKPKNKEIVYRRHSPVSSADIFAGITFPDHKRFIAFPVSQGDVDASKLNKIYTEISFNLYEKEHYDGRDLFIIMLNSGTKTELFTVLCNDLISKAESVENQSKIISEVLKRIAGWERLFFKYKKRRMSENEQRGLFGELLLMKLMIDAGIDCVRCLKAWNEQYNQAQDFRFNNMGVEVKTTLTGTPSNIRISSEYQLDNVGGLNIYLYHFKVKTDDTGLSLTGIIELLTARFNTNEHINLFHLKLAHRGYYLSEKKEYDAQGYSVSKSLAYEVGQDFPKIVKSQLSDMIIDVRYHLLEPLKDEWVVSQEKLFRIIKGGQDDTN